MLAGAAHHDEREWERTAWLTANILNISGKQVKSPVTVNKLLGRRPKIEPSFPPDPQEQVKELVRRQEELNRRKAEREASGA